MGHDEGMKGNQRARPRQYRCHEGEVYGNQGNSGQNSAATQTGNARKTEGTCKGPAGETRQKRRGHEGKLREIEGNENGN